MNNSKSIVADNTISEPLRAHALLAMHAYRQLELRRHLKCPDHAIAKFGKLDIMLNNTAIIDPPYPRIAKNEKYGTILISGSVTTVIGGLATHGYVASKPAIIGLMKDAAAELGYYLFPGKDSKKIDEKSCEVANLKEAALINDDVAKAAVYFGNDNSKYVSGHNFMIDGGVSTTDGAFGIFNYNKQWVKFK
ncbi:hypothetical protein GIB67_006499 [Kingdonia uniflora]|uniref:Uncharacterized protein n=1 Tax=Kingdonia uniflora TaxID=39325 RepID=A0A7J7LEX3_9MAGN|nr:hypothetical protein GIB67_006499 [Kingdonia uniflora]